MVTAAGGGIQAAAWTAQVLTGLDEIYGKEFSDSIGVVSSVSGGSVGAMFFLDRWDDLAARRCCRKSGTRHAFVVGGDGVGLGRLG